MSTKLINSSVKTKWLIECDSGIYRVGNECGKVPPDKDCIIEGWHFKKGKLLKRGSIVLIPGNGNFHIHRNIIEN